MKWAWLMFIFSMYANNGWLGPSWWAWAFVLAVTIRMNTPRGAKPRRPDFLILRDAE
jgi:hypothetical protein